MPLTRSTLCERPDGHSLALRHRLASRSPGSPATRGKALRTLAIDIGGTGIKMIVLDAAGSPVNERARVLTPHPAQPDAVLSVIAEMLKAQPAFDRVSVGFPGVVVQGVTLSAHNLGTDFWKNRQLASDLAALTGRPTRVLNDADLQGYGVIQARGVELVLTLGTGVGSALFVSGRLVPNLELGHHPFKKGMTYEERVCDRELKQLGKKHWSRRVHEMIEQLEPIFNYDALHLGGGNATHVRGELPAKVHLFTNVDGMTGGIQLWSDPG